MPSARPSQVIDPMEPPRYDAALSGTTLLAIRPLSPLLTALALFGAASVSAQNQGLVIRDGSLGYGPARVRPGFDPLGQPASYLITPGQGKQVGSTLFH